MIWTSYTSPRPTYVQFHSVSRGFLSLCLLYLCFFFFWFYSYINALLALIHLWSILRTSFIFFSAISGKGLLINSSSISTINPAPYLLALFMLCIELIITAFTGQHVSRTVLWKTWRICVEWKKNTDENTKIENDFLWVGLRAQHFKNFTYQTWTSLSFSPFPKSLGKYSLFFNTH